MKQDTLHIESFIKGLTTLTGLPCKKVQQYLKANNPFNILEHPHIMAPNEKQLEKISLLNEFIASYNVLKIYECNEKIVLNSSTAAGQYFSALLSGIKDKEKFMVAFLDRGNNIIESKTMSEGSIGQAAVYPREILKYAIACDCNAIILSHNHPGGTKKFSMEDKVFTQRIVDIFHPLQIKVLDHIVVCGGVYSSMAEEGNLPNECKNTANYVAIQLCSTTAEVSRSSHHDINSR